MITTKPTQAIYLGLNPLPYNYIQIINSLIIWSLVEYRDCNIIPLVFPLPVYLMLLPIH